jgi:amino acid transporter
VKNPEREVPAGIIGSLLICSGLYCGVAVVITGMVPFHSIDLDAPLAAAFSEKGITWAGILIAVGAFAGLVTTMLTSQMSAARLLLAMSRDGLLPPLLSRIDPKNFTPITANLFSGTVASLLALFLDINLLSGLVCAGTLTAFIMVCFSVLLLRFDQHLIMPSASSSSRNKNGEKERIEQIQKWKRDMVGLVIVFGCGSGFVGVALAYGMIGPSILLAILFVLGPFLFLCSFFRAHVSSPQPTILTSSVVHSPATGTDNEDDPREEEGGRGGGGIRHMFFTPWVPVIPLLGIGVNGFMMVNLSSAALFGFLVWFALGVIFYFSYSLTHSSATLTPPSSAEEQAQEREDYSPFSASSSLMLYHDHHIHHDHPPPYQNNNTNSKQSEEQQER